MTITPTPFALLIVMYSSYINAISITTLGLGNLIQKVKKTRKYIRKVCFVTKTNSYEMATNDQLFATRIESE